MNKRALAAEATGTFMLVTAILGAGQLATPATVVALQIALSIGFAMTALGYAFGAVSGAHFNPAVTLGLVAGGRFDQSRAVGYVVAQCAGGLLAATLFVFLIGKAPNLAGLANGYDALSPTRAGIVAVFTTELLMTAFFVTVIIGATAGAVPPGFAPIAIGLALTAAYLILIPISNGSVNPARSLATAVWGGSLPLQQLWVFCVAPILGAVLGGLFGRWLIDE